MSFNRENIVWQSADGTWSRGFYEVFENFDAEDFDPEWDVEYGADFEWLASGLPTEEAALEAWDGANPGGHHVVLHRKDPTWAAQLDEKAAKFKQRSRT